MSLASQAGVIALDKHVAYCASKGGIIAMTKVLAKEWGKYGIRVNCVFSDRGAHRAGTQSMGRPPVGDALKKSMPSERFAEPGRKSRLACIPLQQRRRHDHRA